MVEIKNIFDFFINTMTYKRNCFNKGYFYFLLQKKSKPNQLRMNINTKCLCLSHYPGAETRGLGGLIAQYPLNFEVLCFTNGENADKRESKEKPYIKNASKQHFYDVMKATRIKGSKLFDIEKGTLKDNYQTFRKIDISEADYIFVPNVFDTDEDAIALLSHFKKLMREKEYKKNLKIFMYESDVCLALNNYYVDISSIIETKKRMVSQYYNDNSQDLKNQKIVEKITGLNSFRAANFECAFAESFLGFSVQEFLDIPLM